MTRRRLDVELVRRGLVVSRAAAQTAIASGVIEVDGMPATKAATLVAEEAEVRRTDPDEEWASRGAHKLIAALDAFDIPVAGRSAIDVGAAHGGFTDVVLRRGAERVVAVDVGYGQLIWRLRNDPRVEVRERVNIRHADPGDLGAPFDLVVADVSFISLRMIAPVLVACGSAGTDWVLLVKPQFELGKGRVPRGGVVVDDGERMEAVEAVGEAFEESGLARRGVLPSPITGARGNLEYLLWLTR